MKRAIAALIALCCISTVMTKSASAELSDGHSSSLVRKVVVPMYFVEVDESDVSTNDVVGGTCGYAQFEMYGPWPNINLSYGFFELNILATAYSWDYIVSGPNYFRYDNGGGTLWFRREWFGSYNGIAGSSGIYSGAANLWASNGASSCAGTAPDSWYL